MAFQSYSKKIGTSKLCEFICDTVDDLADLPTNKRASAKAPKIGKCAPGSKAVVCSNKTVYILNNAGEWKAFRDSSGGGGSVDIADITDIIGYLDA